MKVLFTYPTNTSLNDWEHEFLPFIKQSLNADKHRFILVENPAEADLIVFLESNSFKTQRHIPNLLQEPLISKYPNKIFTINYEDAPAGFLPGLYAALPKEKFDPLRHKTWSYLFPPNEKVYEVKDIFKPHKYLFSFTGAESHPIRKKIFNHKFDSNYSYKITKIDKWFNHSLKEKSDYVEDILDSLFVLCPRGVACSSHRLFEVMALGRCPVIISDSWVPIRNINWQKCSITVKGAEIDRLPSILGTRLPDAVELGFNARLAWELNFSPANKVQAALSAIGEIYQSRPSEYDDTFYHRYWSSRHFYKLNGWAIEQRIGRKINQKIKQLTGFG